MRAKRLPTFRSVCFLGAGARGDFLFLDFNGIGRRRADCPRYNFSFSVNMASDAGRLCENGGSDGELPSADFRCLKRLLAALASCCVFVRGPRFCFSVHSVFSVGHAKFPRIMRSFRFRFRRTFQFIRTARTGADSFGQGKAGNELPQNCRRFAAVFPFPTPPQMAFPLRAPEKRSDCHPRLTRSNALHFTPCGRAEIPPGKKIALRGFSRLWRVCANFAHTQPAEVSKQAK